MRSALCALFVALAAAVGGGGGVLDARQVLRCAQRRACDDAAPRTLLVTGPFLAAGAHAAAWGNATRPRARSALRRSVSRADGAGWRAAVAAAIDAHAAAAARQAAYRAAAARISSVAATARPAAAVELQVNLDVVTCAVAENASALDAAAAFVQRHGLDAAAAPMLADALQAQRDAAVRDLVAAANAEVAALDTLRPRTAGGAPSAGQAPDAGESSSAGESPSADDAWDDARTLGAFLRLVEVEMLASKRACSPAHVAAVASAVALLERSEAAALARAQRDVDAALAAERASVLAAQEATRRRLLAEAAYGVTNTTAALLAQGVAEAEVARATDVAIRARRDAEPLEAAEAVYRERELHREAEIRAADADISDAEAAGRRASAAPVEGLCGGDRCNSDDRRWLQQALLDEGSRCLAAPPPFELRASIALEASEDWEAAALAIDRRFARLPRLKRLETYGLRTVYAPLVYARKAALASYDDAEARAVQSGLVGALAADLTADKDGGPKADIVVQTAAAVARAYYAKQASAMEQCRPTTKHGGKKHDAPPAPTLYQRLGAYVGLGAADATANATSGDGDGGAPRAPDGLLCSPARAFKHGVRVRGEALARRAREKRALLAEATGDDNAWVAAARRARQKCGEGLGGETYALSDEPEAGRSVQQDPAHRGAAAVRASAAALQLLSDADALGAGELAALLRLDAGAIELGRLRQRAAALRLALADLVRQRPTSKLLDDANAADAAVVRLRTTADAAAARLQEALAAAAFAAALGPPESQNATLEAHRGARRAARARLAAQLSLAAAESTVLADGRVVGGVVATARRLADFVDASGPGAGRRLRALADALDGDGGAGGVCALEASPFYDDVRRAVRIRAFEPSSFAVVGDRWVAALECCAAAPGGAAPAPLEWLDHWLPAQERVGLALLDGKVVVAAVEPAAHAWPTGAAHFAQADGAWRF
ncbi:hypothetical protein M885DRAFT_246824 [Pelagophyceae sp. CCMP2097]|nr:hypothetical protein M885DRAFT_246824 [Pelagophyceae sp. CCMP2097]